MEVSKPWIACATLKYFRVKIDPQITSSQMKHAFVSPGIDVVWTNCMSLAGSFFLLQNCMREMITEIEVACNTAAESRVCMGLDFFLHLLFIIIIIVY